MVNVKPADQLAVPKVAEALAWAGEVFAARGWRHEVWSGTEPVLLANVRASKACGSPTARSLSGWSQITRARLRARAALTRPRDLRRGLDEVLPRDVH